LVLRVVGDAQFGGKKQARQIRAYFFLGVFRTAERLAVRQPVEPPTLTALVVQPARFRWRYLRLAGGLRGYLDGGDIREFHPTVIADADGNNRQILPGAETACEVSIVSRVDEA
jgi:hypothetical protein